MNKYSIYISDEAKKDIRELSDVITFDFSAPHTAFRYIQGLLDTILSLSKAPESFPIQTRLYFLKYGSFVRRINYKKMAIIYTVHSNIVYVHRIMSASLITE